MKRIVPSFIIWTVTALSIYGLVAGCSQIPIVGSIYRQILHSKIIDDWDGPYPEPPVFYNEPLQSPELAIAFSNTFAAKLIEQVIGGGLDIPLGGEHEKRVKGDTIYLNKLEEFTFNNSTKTIMLRVSGTANVTHLFGSRDVAIDDITVHIAPKLEHQAGRLHLVISGAITNITLKNVNPKLSRALANLGTHYLGRVYEYDITDFVLNKTIDHPYASGAMNPAFTTAAIVIKDKKLELQLAIQ